MKRLPGETISGVTYRCKECGTNLGDPEGAPVDFVKWAIDVRAHMVMHHRITPVVNKPLNDLVAAFFIWTTPTGHEVVMSSK